MLRFSSRPATNYAPKVAPERLELSRPYCGHCGLNAARLPVCFRHGAIVTVGIWREIPQRVRVESNHRARLRRALLFPLSYRPRNRTLHRETDRARTGTDPGHNRALCPVKLRPPFNWRPSWCQRKWSDEESNLNLRLFKPALVPHKLSNPIESHEWRRRGSNPHPGGANAAFSR